MILQAGSLYPPSLLTRSGSSSSSSVDELPKRERYVLQVPGSLKIPATDLPSHSQSRHTHITLTMRHLAEEDTQSDPPMLCYVMLCCPPPPPFLPSSLPTSPSTFLNDNPAPVFTLVQRGYKKLSRPLALSFFFNLTYHFITRCFGQLDIQLLVVRTRGRNAPLYGCPCVHGNCSFCAFKQGPAVSRIYLPVA